MSITRRQVMPLFLEACPSFRPAWEEHRRYWGEEELPYIDVGAFAAYVVDLIRDGQTECLPAVFAVAERLFLEGDDYVTELAVIGFLEGLMNLAGHSGRDEGTIVPWLGQESRKAWKALVEYRNGKLPYVHW